VKIHLPNSAFLGNIDPFLAGFDPTSPNYLEITANNKWVSVHPMVLTLIAALGLTLRPENIRWEKFEAASRHYFVRMGLYKLLGIPSGMDVEEHEQAGRFIPLTQIRTSTELTRFITDMIPLLHLDPEPARTLAYIVSELGRNVIEHAGAKNGALLCAQYYKKSHSIKIGIADTGVGINATIAQSHAVATDLQAIRLALMPGITGSSLFFIKSIASVNRDFFMLYSGKGFYKLLKKKGIRGPRLHADPFDDRHSAREDLPFWPGTLVGVDITLNPTEAFSGLLDSIRETFTLAVRERRRERLKRPRFT
jgi:anti-sigma regulatory factor (Ser/Thr protein kinase)